MYYDRTIDYIDGIIGIKSRYDCDMGNFCDVYLNDNYIGELKADINADKTVFEDFVEFH